MRSLRIRLLASFGLVIALCLIAAGMGSVWLMRDEQAAAAEVRIGRLVEPISQRLRRMQMTGAPPGRVAEELVAYARFFQVRILLVDGDNRVIMDTEVTKPIVGEQIVQPAHREVEGPSESYRASPRRIRGEDLFLFESSVRDPGAPPVAVPSDIRNANVIVAVPAGDVTAAWAKLLPRFLLAGGISAIASVVVAGLIARRITRPLVEMTSASRAIAQGDYSQRIEVRGDDEVAVLGNAFNEMADQVDRSQRTMRQLLADVSHDLKTPLTSIQGYSQAMLDGVLEDDAERVRAAEIVHQEAERMRALVEDLLYLSQIEAGQLPLTLEPVALDDVVAASAQRFRYQAETAGVTVRPALNGAPVLADERRLDQVLANLLDNAIRYAPAGSEVLLRTARVPGSVLIEVHNGGEPIPPDDLPHVFDRFYQVDRARTRAGHSGLGLAIVRELVQAHGGDISVQSTRAGGTVFTVRLPAVPAAPPATGRFVTRRDEPERGPPVPALRRNLLPILVGVVAVLVSLSACVVVGDRIGDNDRDERGQQVRDRDGWRRDYRQREERQRDERQRDERQRSQENRGLQPFPREGDRASALPVGAFLGVTVQPVDDGVEVQAVVPGSAAARAGVRPGDVIVQADGRDVRDAQALRDAVMRARAGEQYALLVRRDGREQTLRVERASQAGAAPFTQPGGMPRMQPGLQPDGGFYIPPGMMPQGMFAPGMMPPGMMPQGMFPPGVMPPWMIPPGMTPPNMVPPAAPSTPAPLPSPPPNQ